MTMFSKNYHNFVRPCPIEPCNNKSCHQNSLSGDEARKLYLEVVSDIKNHQLITVDRTADVKTSNKKNICKTGAVDISNTNLFLSVQNNDINTVKQALDNSPDKINIVDDFGWSVLMIACQANSIEIVKELLDRGVNTSIRDRAGNSAQSLVIKNKNYILANIIQSHNINKSTEKQFCINNKEKRKTKKKHAFSCQICGKEYPDRQEHLSSTIHNMNASKRRKIPTNYVIPQSNKGYQIMLKTGWDKDNGLGKDGCGNKYPIRATQKKDRKGLGHEEKKEEISEVPVRYKTRKMLSQDYHDNRKMEINFRRQFY